MLPGLTARDITKELRRESRDIASRLASIHHDVEFVNNVADAFYPLPIISNFRCGAWYTQPDRTVGASYFKSTDGHMHHWQFSLKRTNLHLLPIIQRNTSDNEPTGCIIVDSTRRGKRFPDALSKTIPIWCAVLNLASQRRYGSPADIPELSCASSVSPSECEQIKELIPGWTDALLDSDIEVPFLTRPLRPVFVYPPHIPPVHLGTTFHTIVLLCASDPEGVSLSPLTYVQGAGDDHENWALGLTPDLYWRHKRELTALLTDRVSLISRVESIVGEASRNCCLEWFSIGSRHDTQISGTPIDMDVCLLRDIRKDKQHTLVVYCSQSEDTIPEDNRCILLGIPPGKRGVAMFSERLRGAVVRAES